jgi:hypothetical protein
MKEADITFGSLYLCEIDGDKHCKRIVRKVPPEAGRQRSRTYVWENPDGTQPVYDFMVDASKIICPWSEYEKTPEYAERHRARVMSELEATLSSSLSIWYEQLRQYVRTLTGATMAVSYLPYDVRNGVESVQDFEERILKQRVTLSLADLVKYTKIPLPPLDAVQTAFETKAEIESQFLKASLPATEGALLEAIDTGGYSIAQVNQYVSAVTKTGTPGPHAPLVKLAVSDPRDSFLKGLTEDDQFAYLIPHLDWS